MTNNILDYEQAEKKLQEIVERGIITQTEDLGNTKYGLPIEHYVVGTGTKDIVITGATHGAEIVTTDFVIKLMEDIDPSKKIWDSILGKFRIHFIPILNPEGYLISTSAVRKIIPREMSQEEAEKICKQYYLAYRKDNTNPEEIKRYQEMFKDVDYTCISEKYSSLRDAIKNLFEKYPDLPKSCLQIWSANGSGIDIQANSEFNPTVSEIVNGPEEKHMISKIFSNINIAHPGPINCPCDREEGFAVQKETEAITSLLEELNKEGRLFLYLNYHSTGGMIFQRPAEPPEGLDIEKEQIELNEMINLFLSIAYSSRTYKNTGINTEGVDNRKTTRYAIMKEKANATSTNDIFRLEYPQDLLVELSGMGGNPIAPYGDINGNYTNLMNSNLDAVRFVLLLGSVLREKGERFYDKVKSIKGHDDYDVLMWFANEIYNGVYRKIMRYDDTRAEFGERKSVEADVR